MARLRHAVLAQGLALALLCAAEYILNPKERARGTAFC